MKESHEKEKNGLSDQACEPTHPVEKKYYLGQSDPPLSPRGKKQAQRLADFLRDVRIDSIFCSDLQRAVQTRCLSPKNSGAASER
jgi:bisphosphoglycerate-dependent phosphoglycerate mutase